jgi:hypothetical protein
VFFVDAARDTPGPGAHEALYMSQNLQDFCPLFRKQNNSHARDDHQVIPNPKRKIQNSKFKERLRSLSFGF